MRQLQLNLLRSHRPGVGRYTPRDVVRAMLLLRAASLAQGALRLPAELVEALLALLERQRDADRAGAGLGRRVGRSRAARAPGAGAGGRGRGVARRASACRAGLALRGAGLQPLTLEAKEGLALINGTQFSTAFAVLAVRRRAPACGRRRVAAAALSTEVLLGSFQPARADVQALRPVSRARSRPRGGCVPMREDSALVASHANCGRVQDAYSLRCVPQVMGAAWDAIGTSSSQLAGRDQQRQRQSARASPASDEVVSAGLFHAQPVALVADYLKIAVAEIASIAERRIDRLTDGRVSELPAVLATAPGLESGYMMAQYTAAALVSENKTLCHPASVDSIPDRRRASRTTSAWRRSPRATRARSSTTRRGSWRSSCCAAAAALEFRRPLRAGARQRTPLRLGAAHRAGARRRPAARRAVRDGRPLGALRRSRRTWPRRCSRHDAGTSARTVRAPRGTSLTCKGWVQEAALRMLMNNLDPEVAERPEDLVVYGGTGRAARSWEAFDRIVAALRALERRRDAARPVGQAGRACSGPTRARRAC